MARKRSSHSRPAAGAHRDRTAVRARRPPPYVRRLERIARLAVWLVDGAYVRETIDEGFGASGHHFSYDAIPRNEIWVEAETAADEQQYVIRQAVTERRLMARGMDYEAARTMAIAEGRRVRAQAAAASGGD